MSDGGTLVGKKNIYFCSECGHGFVTVDRDNGVTPFMTTCDRAPCAAAAYSFFYRAPQEMLKNIEPAYEWYRPSEEDLAGKSDQVKDHVARGGLLMRRYRATAPA